MAAKVKNYNFNILFYTFNFGTYTAFIDLKVKNKKYLLFLNLL